jgi:hypothetical protein
MHEEQGNSGRQHEEFFQMKGTLYNLRKVFSVQLVTQLKAWQAAREEIILFINVNKNVYSGPFARALRGEGLLVEEKTFCSTRKQAPHSHSTGKVAIVGTYATPRILCTNVYLSPHGAGVGDHWFHLHNFDAHTVLGTDYPKTVCPTCRVLCCKVKHTVKQYNKVLKQMLIHHHSFEKLQQNHQHMSAADFQLLFNKWDKEVTHLMLGSEKQCNKFCDGSIEFSPVVGI